MTLDHLERSKVAPGGATIGSCQFADILTLNYCTQDSVSVNFTLRAYLIILIFSGVFQFVAKKLCSRITRESIFLNFQLLIIRLREPDSLSAFDYFATGA